MKKLTLLALAAITLAPTTSFAESWTKEVTNAAEFKTALNAVGAGAVGDTYEIICNWEAGDLQSAGKLKPTMTAGKLIIRSNQTDFEKMPQLQLAFEWNADAPAAEVTKRMSVIFENMNLFGNGSYLIDHRRDMFADTIALRRCDIHGQARSILRFDGDKSASDPKLTAADMSIDVVEVRECMIHETAQNSGDNWSVFRTFMPVNSFIMKDNMFFNSPYTKSLWETRNPGETATIVTFANNMVLLGENKTMSTSGFTALMPTDKLAAGSQLYLYNNVFAAPQEGYIILKDAESNYSGTSAVSLANGIVFAYNNVVDVETYKSMEDLSATLLESATTVIPQGNTTLADYPDFSWATGNTFQDASNNMYYILNSNPWKTAGYNYDAEGVGEYYVGPSIAYVDEFPTPASVSVTINGPKYITYTISPEKSQYYVGDEVTITLKDHNSTYRTFNSFEGWSDGSTELNRTETLGTDLNLTATFSNNDDVVAAFDFSTITKNANLSTYDADIYYGMDEAYRAVLKGFVCDTATAQTAPFPYIEGNFQCRPAKFGEDAAELQMPIISRRTAAIAKEAQRDYVTVEFTTKDMSGVEFSCYVGSDNNAAKTQALEYTTDGESWTRLSSIDIESGVWGELKAMLPETLCNQDKVTVRIIGDLTNGHIFTLDPNGGLVDESGAEDPEAYAAADAFEYIGNICITATTHNGISDVTGSDKASNTNAPVYNMMGMKVAKGTKGLLIQNGKKFIVK